MTRPAHRALALLLLLAALTGCGKYGPPARSKSPSPTPPTTEQPAPPPAPEAPPAAPAPGGPDTSQPQGEEPPP